MNARRIIVCTLLLLALLVPSVAQGYTRSEHRYRRIVARTLIKHHVSKPEIAAAQILCDRESDWRPRCVTGSCLGLFQLMTKSPKWANPYWNTWKANRYVHHRYGTWRAALNHSYRHGWY